MKIHALRDAPSPYLASALETFETQFDYPLGPGKSFRISHGSDYPRFFRSMGESRCFVVERNSRVLATLSVAIRPIFSPGGAVRSAAYIGDLKRDPNESSSLTFFRLAQAALNWALPQADCAYGVVMDGTRALPPLYSGRLGIPLFASIGKIFVIRLPTTSAAGEHCNAVSVEDGLQIYRTLVNGQFAASSGDPFMRSAIDPIWLVEKGGKACGRLEDTVRAKRLIDNTGVEMRSAHLACLAWNEVHAAYAVIQSARCHAARLGFPALFISVAAQQISEVRSVLGALEMTAAPATIYGVGLSRDGLWNMNTSEI